MQSITADDKTGTQYQLTVHDKLGEGAFGVVFSASRDGRSADVALKEVTIGEGMDEATIEAAEREHRVWAKLSKSDTWAKMSQSKSGDFESDSWKKVSKPEHILPLYATYHHGNKMYYEMEKAHGTLRNKIEVE